MTRCSAMFLLSMMLLAGTSAAESPTPSRATIDTSYIASDSAVAVFVNVRQLLSHPVRDPDARQLVMAEFFDNSGFDFNNVTHVLVQFAGVADSERSFDELYAVTFRFDRPVDKDELVTAMLDRASPAEFNGMPYYRSSFDGRGCAFFPDEHTVIFAHQSRLHAVMASPYTMSALVSKLRAADGNADLVAVFELSQAPDLVPSLARDALGLRLSADTQRIIQQIAAATISVNLTANDPLRVQMFGNNVDSTRRIADGLQLLRQFCQEKYVPWRKEFLTGDVADARIRKMTVDLLDQLLTSTQVELCDDRVDVRLESNGGFVSALDLFFEAHAAELRNVDDAAPAEEFGAGVEGAIEIREPALPR